MQTRRGQCPCSGAPGQLEKKTRGQGHAVSVRVRDFGWHSVDVVTVNFARMACARQQLWQACAGRSRKTAHLSQADDSLRET